MMATIPRESPTFDDRRRGRAVGSGAPRGAVLRSTSALSLRLEGRLSGSSRIPRDRSILPGAVVSDKARRSFIEPLTEVFLSEISNSLELD